jgi:SPP1 family predicted phage head-tail adaptor
MNAGDLNKRIAILLKQDAPDAGFDIESTYTEVAQAWARIEPVAGSVYYGSIQAENAVTHRITIRSRRDLTITADHVIEHKGSRYRVRRVSDVKGQGWATAIEAEELGAINA